MSDSDQHQHEGFSSLLKTPWIRSAIKFGIVITIIGLVILILLILFDIENSPLFSNAKAFVTQYGLLGIFLTTTMAGTVIPLGSPALVVAASLLGIPKIPLILVASTGFTVGVMINYTLAYRLGSPYVAKKMSPERFEDIVRLWNRWGWVLYTIFGLIPMLPVELLSLVCGLLKARISIFLTLSFLPRLIVFAIFAYFGEVVSGWF